MKLKAMLIAPTLAVCLTSCGGPQAPELTTLEKRALQTRDYKHSKEIVFNSVVSYFQDQGFTLQQADKDTGFITAISPQERTSTGAEWWFLGRTEEQNTKCTAFVEKIGEGSRLRLTFTLTTLTQDELGSLDMTVYTGATRSTQQDTPIYDAEVYRRAFTEIESAIFLRSKS